MMNLFHNRRKKYKTYRNFKIRRTFLTALGTVLYIAAFSVAGWYLYSLALDLSTRPITTDLSNDDEVKVSEEERVQEIFVVDSVTIEHMQYAYISPELLISDQLSSVLSHLKSAGYNGVLLHIKDDDGILYYKSDYAQKYIASAIHPDSVSLSELIDTVRSFGLEPAVQLSCFKDHTATRFLHNAAVKYDYSDINWIDKAQADGGVTWLNPNSAEAQNYILEIIYECAHANVSSIFLSYVQFPVGDALSMATFDEKGVSVDKSQILTSFLINILNTYDNKDLDFFLCVDALTLFEPNSAFGDSPASLLNSAQNICLNLCPEQFGSYYSLGSFSLNASTMELFDLTDTILSNLSLPGDVSISAQIQGYSSMTATKKYDKDDILQQVQACQNHNIFDCIVVNPDGLYDALY